MNPPGKRGPSTPRVNPSVLREKAASGMTAAAFAHEIGVHPATVREWAARFGVPFRLWGRPPPRETAEEAETRLRALMGQLRGGRDE